MSNTPIQPNALFCNTAEEANHCFFQEIQQLKNQNPQAHYQALPIDPPEDNLSIQTLHLPQEGSQHLLVLASGTHGIEGFVGSALQRSFLVRHLPLLAKHKIDLLILHGVNPWGFQHLRRFTSDNIDLNRNFVMDSRTFESKNQGYQKVERFLNPSHPAKCTLWSQLHYLVKALLLIRKYSLDDLRQAILEGQYAYPKGIFFGGQHYSQQTEAITDYLTPFRSKYQTVLFIDLHTGYGQRGKLQLYPNLISEAHIRERLEKIFDGYEIDYGQGNKRYNVTGSFADYWKQLFTQSTYLPMVFEYGTLNSQKISGSLKSLYNVILENQGYHYGYRSPKDKKQIRHAYREMFYPSCPHWRKGILQQTHQIFERSLPRFAELS